ncbi:MAG TPA: pitrilysin family protein, partial [Nitrospirota bacterium]
GPVGDRYLLSNGMVLLVKENHTLPIVTMSMIIKAGSIVEPDDKAGLAGLTAGLLMKGAAGMSAEQISDAADFIGASLDVGGGTDFATAGLSVLTKDADTGFSLLSKVLTSPDFKQEEIDRAKTAVKAAIIRKEQEPDEVAQKTYQEAIFGADSPYGRQVEGTAKTVDAITRDDIVNFHKTRYVPNDCILAVVGDTNVNEVKALIEKYMADWRPREQMPVVLKKADIPAKITYIKVNRDITQANILMGHPGVERENPDYYTLYVMNYILGGGGFVSRILDKIRDDMGLAYSAYSYFNPFKYDGSYTIGLETKNESAAQAIDETLKIVERMKKEPVTDKELKDAKDFITGSFPRKLDTNSKIAGLLTQIQFYGLDLNYFEMYEREITKITKEDVLKAAQKYLHPDKVKIIVVGNIKETKLEGR